MPSTGCSKCSSPAVAGTDLCGHHTQMARMMKLASRSGSPTQPTTKGTSSMAPKSSAGYPTTTAVKPSTGLLLPELVIPGEVVKWSIECSRNRISQIISATNYRLHIHPASRNGNAESIPWTCVKKIGYATQQSSTVSSMELLIQFKDWHRPWTIGGGNVPTILAKLQATVWVSSPASFFAFARGNSRLADATETLGHCIYDIRNDFKRMGIDLGSSNYRLTKVNQSYSICPTYPPSMVVPAKMSDSDVSRVAEFRSKGRFPICCWVHGNCASLWRCAQPKRGILNEKNASDTAMLAQIGTSNPNSSTVWIVDARPELNARVNNFTGGGTESGSIRHAKVSFMNIANIHAMRESLQAVEALHLVGEYNHNNNAATGNWLTRVEETKWLGYLRLVLSAAINVATAINNSAQTVIVHCSDGWDRTGQICALAQLMLDPHYRTLTGFMQLIEKEWILVGHKFNDRIRPGCEEDDKVSPIFIQFLDCTWQLLRLYPTYFEFNAKAIEFIATHLFSGKYGTFLCNCDRERKTLDIVNRTPSLWAYMSSKRSEFTNALFRPQLHDRNYSGIPLLPPVTAVTRRINLWSEYYLRGCAVPSFESGSPVPPLWWDTADTWTAQRTGMDEVESTVAALHGRIQELERKLASVEIKAAAAPPPPAVVAANPPTTSVLKSNAAAVVVPTSSGWECRICSKLNSLDASRCSVCGRPRA